MSKHTEDRVAVLNWRAKRYLRHAIDRNIPADMHMVLAILSGKRG